MSCHVTTTTSKFWDAGRKRNRDTLQSVPSFEASKDEINVSASAKNGTRVTMHIENAFRCECIVETGLITGMSNPHAACGLLPAPGHHSGSPSLLSRPA